MMKKLITALVMLSLFGFSTAYAHDSGNNDDAAGAVLIAGLAVITTAFLIEAFDRHDDYAPSPRRSHGRPYDYRGNDYYRYDDNRGHDGYQSRDYGHDDGGQHDRWYQGESRGGESGKKWDGR